MSKKIYCGIGNTPKGYRLGSMVECLENKKVNLYGLYKIDSKLIKEKLAEKKKESKKDKPVEEESSIMCSFTSLLLLFFDEVDEYDE